MSHIQAEAEALKRNRPKKSKAQVIPKLEKIVRNICGDDAHLILKGSSA